MPTRQRDFSDPQALNGRIPRGDVVGGQPIVTGRDRFVPHRFALLHHLDGRAATVGKQVRRIAFGQATAERQPREDFGKRDGTGRTCEAAPGKFKGARTPDHGEIAHPPRMILMDLRQRGITSRAERQGILVGTKDRQVSKLRIIFHVGHDHVREIEQLGQRKRIACIDLP